jgi:hypothetical protein
MTGHVACREQDMVIRRLEAANDHQALAAVADMAAGYPLPHNVLGTPLAPTYVGQLAKHPAGGWYGLFIDGQIRVTAHLALYGQGDCRTHSLWPTGRRCSTRWCTKRSRSVLAASRR